MEQPHETGEGSLEADASEPARDTEVFAFASAFVEEWADANRLTAHRLGLDVAGGMPEFSPAWWQSEAERRRRALASITSLEPVDDVDRRALAFMTSDLEAKVARDGFGIEPRSSWLRQIVLASSLAEIEPRLVDDVVRSLRGFCASLDAARAGTSPWSRWTRHEVEAALASLDKAGARAAHAAMREALADTADELERSHAPNAPEERTFHRDRLAAEARVQLGDDVDLAEALAWATEELQREHEQLVDACRAVDPTATTPADALAHIRRSPDGVIEGEEAMQRWLRDLMIQSTEAVDGVVLDVPARHRLEIVLAPPNGEPAGYEPPSRDGTTRARVTLPIGGGRRYWPGAYSTVAHHEGVPGHHVQMAGLPTNPDLCAYQQVMHIPAHTEGWAVYAERLMVELGHHEAPQRRFAHHHEQVKRFALGVADLGIHAEGWRPAKATAVLRTLGSSEAAAERELLRIAARPFHRAAYILGLGAWLEARSRCGADLYDFHRAALSLGPVGINTLAGAAVEALALQQPR